MLTLGPIAFLCLGIACLIIFATFVKHAQRKDDGLTFGFWAMVGVGIIGSIIIGIATINWSPQPTVEFEETNELSKTSRGDKGYGSTGE